MKRQTTGCSRIGIPATNDSTPFKILLNKSCTLILTLAMVLLTAACTKSDSSGDDGAPDVPPGRSGAVYVLNEGMFMSNNATLSLYDPQARTVESDIFYKANSALLGDSPTSLSMFKGKAFITISNSGKIYIINPQSGLLTGKITNLNSPRYIEFISDDKAYVSNLWSDVIDIINPTTEQKIGTITLGKGNYAERFVRVGDYVYTNLWSYGTKILKIDTRDDRIVDVLEVGIQPMTLLADNNGKLWTLTDGGWEDHPIAYTDPEIVSIDLSTFSVERRFTLKRNTTVMYDMTISEDGKDLYYVSDGIYRMSTKATSLPSTPLIGAMAGNFYSIGIDPGSGEIYIGDAIDFQQNGKVFRYSKQGELIDTFKAGINPGEFGFIPAL